MTALIMLRTIVTIVLGGSGAATSLVGMLPAKAVAHAIQVKAVANRKRRIFLSPFGF